MNLTDMTACEFVAAVLVVAIIFACAWALGFSP